MLKKCLVGVLCSVMVANMFVSSVCAMSADDVKAAFAEAQEKQDVVEGESVFNQIGNVQYNISDGWELVYDNIVDGIEQHLYQYGTSEISVLYFEDARMKDASETKQRVILTEYLSDWMDKSDYTELMSYTNGFTKDDTVLDERVFTYSDGSKNYSGVTSIRDTGKGILLVAYDAVTEEMTDAEIDEMLSVIDSIEILHPVG